MNLHQQIESIWKAIKALRRGGITPIAHSTTHDSGGADEIDILDLGGYPNGSPAVLFLREDGTWATPAAGSSETGAFGSEPGSPNEGDLYFPNNAPFIERYDGAEWETWGPNYKWTPPISGDFAWVNQGGASVSTTNGGILLTAPAGAGNDCRIRSKAAPSTPYTITACFVGARPFKVDFINFGILFRQSSDGKLAALMLQHSAAGGSGFVLRSNKYTNAFTNSAAYTTNAVDFIQPIWLRISDDGANRICSVSTDGLAFQQLHSVSRTDFLTADEVGFFCESNNSTFAAVARLVSWEET